MIPTLQARLVTLSPFTLEDAPLVQEYAGHAEIARTTLHVPHPYPEGAAENWIASHRVQYEDRTSVIFAIRTLANELVGVISLSLNLPNQMAELGYWIGVPFWNRGFCSDAARRIIQYGFEDLALNKIYARHLGGNGASGKVMENAGMTIEGVQRQHVLKNNVPTDVIEFGILKSEYKPERNGRTGCA